MDGGPSFIEYILRSDWRFLQEREIGLDLYQSGALGVAVCALGVASATVFFLALFQILPRPRHIAGLLGGLGLVAALVGLAATYWNFTSLATQVDEIVSEAAGPRPVTLGQEAVVVALPLLLGISILFTNIAGCAYLALFWSGQLIPRAVRRAATRPERPETTKRAATRR